jgi:hypothetical protein
MIALDFTDAYRILHNLKKFYPYVILCFLGYFLEHTLVLCTVFILTLSIILIFFHLLVNPNYYMYNIFMVIESQNICHNRE